MQDTVRPTPRSRPGFVPVPALLATVPAPAADAGIDTLRLHFLAAHTRMNVLPGLLAFLVVVEVVAGETMGLPYWLWIAFALLQTGARLLAARGWARMAASESPECVSCELRKVMLSAFAAGGMWGLGWFLAAGAMSPFELLCYLFGTLIFTAFSALSFGVWPPAFLAALLAAMAPSLPVLIEVERVGHELTAGALLACLALVGLALLTHRQFLRLVGLQQTNLGLLGQVQAERDAAVAARAVALEESVRADAANRAKSMFLASVSHDLRQPMHALSLYLDTIRDERLQARERRLLEHARQCSGQLNDMFDALLTVSRLDAGALETRPETVDLDLLFEQLRVEFERQAVDAGLVLQVRAGARRHVHADPALLLRILRNLLSNAVRYTARGGVMLVCRTDAHGWRLEVRDSGPGIAVESQDRVFEEFVQLGDGPRRGQGIGLGLATVARLARLMGSEVKLRSSPGLGSVFSLVLPAVCQVPRPRMVEVLRPDVSMGAGGTAVVIDDDPQVLHATCALLTEMGFVALAARSLPEASARLVDMDVTPVLLVSDHSVDRLGGAHVIETLRDDFNEEIPALLVTGDTAPDTLAVLRDGPYLLLHKPVDARRLHEALARLGLTPEARQAA